jgi:hypothetical protein
MDDAMMPFARVQADARYDLARLADLLPRVGKHLEALGVDTLTANALQVQALEVRASISVARETALRQQATQVPA